MSKKLISKRMINKITKFIFSPLINKKPKTSTKTNLTKNLFKKYKVIHIESGSKIVFSPEGTEYAQNKLKKLYKSDEKVQWFGITPQNQYQIEHKWPNVEKFVNVNLPGSIETDKTNWLGYIGAWEDDKKQALVVNNLLTLLNNTRPLLKGKIVKETNGEYRIIFFVSQTSLEDASKEI